jgi:hypothetical protein
MDEIQQARDYGAMKEAEGLAKGVAEGLAMGIASLARALLAVLGARGITVSPEARARIDACKDNATLERWIVHAATAGSVEEVLATPEASA